MILTRKKLTELYNDENFITLFEFNWYRHFQNEKSIRDLKSNVLKKFRSTLDIIIVQGYD